jgi:hypothetical protein
MKVARRSKLSNIGQQKSNTWSTKVKHVFYVFGVLKKYFNIKSLKENILLYKTKHGNKVNSKDDSKAENIHQRPT